MTYPKEQRGEDREREVEGQEAEGQVKQNSAYKSYCHIV